MTYIGWTEPANLLLRQQMFSGCFNSPVIRRSGNKAVLLIMLFLPFVGHYREPCAAGLRKGFDLFVFSRCATLAGTSSLGFVSRRSELINLH